jgi:hypothetical protein
MLHCLLCITKGAQCGFHALQWCQGIAHCQLKVSDSKCRFHALSWFAIYYTLPKQMQVLHFAILCYLLCFANWSQCWFHTWYNSAVVGSSTTLCQKFWMQVPLALYHTSLSSSLYHVVYMQVPLFTMIPRYCTLPRSLNVGANFTMLHHLLRFAKGPCGWVNPKFSVLLVSNWGTTVWSSKTWRRDVGDDLYPIPCFFDQAT